MPTIFVIGSNCFTGSHIVDALLADGGNQVVGLSRSPEYRPLFLPYAGRDLSGFEFVQLDTVKEFDRLTALLDERRPEYVINVAALSEVGLSNERPVEYFDINTLAVVKLCDHLRRRDWLRRYVHISSAEILGSCEGLVTEDAPFRPSTPYAVSKAAADLFLETFRRNHDFPVTMVRSTNVYGAHQQLFKIIPRTAIYLKLGRTIELHGGGTSAKSFIHIRDVVRGLQLAMASDELGAWNFSVPSDRTVADVVRTVCEQMGRDFESATQVVGERLGQDSRYLLDCTRARRVLGWSPQVDFDDGVAETIAWVERHWHTIRELPLVYQHKV